jgi:hypothetical protein
MLARVAPLIALAGFLAACATPRHYVQIAEGLSSPTIAEGIQVAPRKFLASQLVEACRGALPVAKLKVEPARLELTAGAVYSLSSLTVVAVDRADVAVAGVPIVLEAEERSPPILQLRSDDPDLDQGRIRVINGGSFRMRIRTTCALPPAEAIVEARVEG